MHSSLLGNGRCIFATGQFGERTGDGRPDPSAHEPPPKPTLVLNLPEERLEGLQNKPGQKLALEVEKMGAIKSFRT